MSYSSNELEKWYKYNGDQYSNTLLLPYVYPYSIDVMKKDI